MMKKDCHMEYKIVLDSKSKTIFMEGKIEAIDKIQS